MAVAAAAAIVGPSVVEMARLAVQQHALDHQLADLQAQEQALVSRQQRLEQDDVYVEGLIRSTFKFAKPGELVIPLASSTDRR